MVSNGYTFGADMTALHEDVRDRYSSEQSDLEAPMLAQREALRLTAECIELACEQLTIVRGVLMQAEDLQKRFRQASHAIALVNMKLAEARRIAAGPGQDGGQP
jgi:hypothetical protein